MTEMATQPSTTDPHTAKGLIEFLDAAIDKGWFNLSSAKALKTACQKMLGIEDDWEALDLRTLDIDQQFERFRNLKRIEYSDGSMRIYRTRLSQAIKMHLAVWRTTPPGSRTAPPHAATVTVLRLPRRPPRVGRPRRASPIRTWTLLPSSRR